MRHLLAAAGWLLFFAGCTSLDDALCVATCNSASACVEDGDSLLRSYRPYEASCSFARGLKFDPHSERARFGRAKAHALLRRKDDAIKDFDFLTAARDDHIRRSANGWLGILRGGVPVAIFYRDSAGCQTHDLDDIYGTKLGMALAKSGAFVATTKHALPAGSTWRCCGGSGSQAAEFTLLIVPECRGTVVTNQQYGIRELVGWVSVRLYDTSSGRLINTTQAEGRAPDGVGTETDALVDAITNTMPKLIDEMVSITLTRTIEDH